MGGGIEYGARVRQRREACGMTVEQLARAVSVTLSRMISIEGGAGLDDVLEDRIEAALATAALRVTRS